LRPKKIALEDSKALAKVTKAGQIGEILTSVEDGALRDL
jgi:hypothetical protein